MDLYGKVFYANFVNNKSSDLPYVLENEYELVEKENINALMLKEKSLYKEKSNGMKDVFDKIYDIYDKHGLTGEPFIQNKIEYTGGQQVYYAIVKFKNISGYKLGEYTNWYEIEFSETGEYDCTVSDYSSFTDDFFKKEDYKCNIKMIPAKTNAFLKELFRIPTNLYNSGRKNNILTSFEDYDAKADDMMILKCNGAHYLCTEISIKIKSEVWLFDMAYHDRTCRSYNDQSIGYYNCSNISVFISHFHSDHINGLVWMANQFLKGNDYNVFFSRMNFYAPNYNTTASMHTIVNAIHKANRAPVLYDIDEPFYEQYESFGIGLINTSNEDDHPHCHGLFMVCRFKKENYILITGDTVYRGIYEISNEYSDMPGLKYLIACHHGGNFDKGSSCRSDNKKFCKFIPTPGADNPVVFYSANGNGITSRHPYPEIIQLHHDKGWVNKIITNANSVYIDKYGILTI